MTKSPWDLEVILFSYILVPPSAGCSPPDVRRNPDADSADGNNFSPESRNILLAPTR